MNNKMKVVQREERNVLDELLYDHEDDELDGETRPRETFTKIKNVEAMEVDGELTFSDSECSCEDHSSANSDLEVERDRDRSSQQQHIETSTQQQTVKKPIETPNDEREEFAKSPSLKIEIRRKSRHTVIRHDNGKSHHHRARDHDDNHQHYQHHHNRREERTKRTERLPIVVRNNSNGRLHSSRDQTLEKSSRNGSASNRTHNNGELLKYFFKDAIYFMVKSNNMDNVDISMRDGVWSTPSQNEVRWNSAFKQFRNVILVFSVKESGRFAGFARLSSESDYDCEPVNWILPSGIAPFGGVFYIDWICKHELPFTQTAHLYNSFNDSKPVKIARDGQEIEPQIGEELCRLFPVDDSVDLIPHLKRMKKQTQNRKKTKHIRGPFMSTERPNNNNTGRLESYNSISRGQMSYVKDIVSGGAGGNFDRRTRSTVSSSFDRSRLQLHSAGNNTNRSRAAGQYHPYSRSQSNFVQQQYAEQSSQRLRHYSRQNSSLHISVNHSGYGHSSGGYHNSHRNNHDHDRDARRTIRRDYH